MLLPTVVDEENENDSDDSSSDFSEDSIEALREEFKEQIASLENKIKQGQPQFAALTTKINDLCDGKVALQDYTIDITREEVKCLRKKNINA